MSSLITGSLHLKEKKRKKNAELNLPSWASSFGNRPKAIIPKRAYSNNRFFPIVHKSIGIDSWKNKKKTAFKFFGRIYTIIQPYTIWSIHLWFVTLTHHRFMPELVLTCNGTNTWLLFILSSVITLDSLIMFCYQIIGLERSIF